VVSWTPVLYPATSLALGIVVGVVSHPLVSVGFRWSMPRSPPLRQQMSPWYLFDTLRSFRASNSLIYPAVWNLIDSGTFIGFWCDLSFAIGKLVSNSSAGLGEVDETQLEDWDPVLSIERNNFTKDGVYGFVVCVLSSILESVVAKPFLTVQTRLELQDRKPDGGYEYTGVFNCLSTIVEKEGVSALYKGIILGIPLTLTRDLFGQCVRAHKHKIAHRITEAFPDLREKYRVLDKITHALCWCTIQCMTYMVPLLLTRPLEVIVRRMDAGLSSGTLQCAQDIYRDEGIGGFFKGIGPELLFMTPGILTAFISDWWLYSPPTDTYSSP